MYNQIAISFVTPSITSRDFGVELFIGKAREQLGKFVKIWVISNMYGCNIAQINHPPLL